MSKQSAIERAARAAAGFGVNRTDLRLLGALRHGALTTGQVAEAVQLSPAAATTAIQ